MSEPHDTAGPGWGLDAARPGLPQEATPTVEPSPVTGDGVVDAAVSRLQDLGAVPLDERPAVFDAVHRTLQDRLADVEG